MRGPTFARARAARMLATRRAAAIELVVVLSILASGVLAGIDTYLVLAFGALSLSLRGVGLRSVGTTVPNRPATTVIAGLAIGALWSLVDVHLVEPVIEGIVDAPLDLSRLEGLKGNLASYLAMLAIVWLLVAPGEELTYRGYLLNRAADIFGRTRQGWTASLLIVSACFGLAHAYQGAAGIVGTSYVALGLGALYFAAGRNLWLPIVVHGSYDTMGLTLIYLDLYPALR